MEILRLIKEYADKKEKEFLLIGGHAVSAYGFMRQTGDIDLLVPKNDRDYWLELVKSLGYTPFQEHEFFCRLKKTPYLLMPNIGPR